MLNCAPVSLAFHYSVMLVQSTLRNRSNRCPQGGTIEKIYLGTDIFTVWSLLCCGSLWIGSIVSRGLFTCNIQAKLLLAFNTNGIYVTRSIDVTSACSSFLTAGHETKEFHQILNISIKCNS